MSPPPCLGGASHGWVPVDTLSAPVLLKGTTLWVAHSTATTLKLLQHGSGALVTSAWFASAVAELWNTVPQETRCEKLTDEDVDEMILEADSKWKKFFFRSIVV